MKMNEWLYDEFKHCGVDYSKAGQAEMFDEQHQKFRDYEREFREMMDFLGLHNTEDKTIVDLGCGTGAISIFAASLFKAVYAVDISNVMIEKAKKKLNKDVHNLKFVNAGFLSYEHEGDRADVVVTKVAFHHLPDFWKQIALLRINRMLKMGGLLYIHDIVFQFDPQEYVSKINSWISAFEKAAGEEFRREVETHIREEYSTFGWIMKGMIEKAGFTVEKCRSADGFVTEHACRKVNELNCAKTYNQA
ncbi:MAG: methyltransferase domain-containing protein [Candidatus Omnitrophota bacterium]|jgi:ubiquinone/menaquinone biosynthesis C-methylase UbiE